MVANKHLKCYMKKQGTGFYRTCKDIRTGKQVRGGRKKKLVIKKEPVKKEPVKKEPVKKKVKLVLKKKEPVKKKVRLVLKNKKK